VLDGDAGLRRCHLVLQEQQYENRFGADTFLLRPMPQGRKAMTPCDMLGLLVVGHALCDYPLQGDFLARAKNRVEPIAGVPFWQALSAHSVIHGGAVALVTGMPILGIAEAVAHWLIDDAKCRGRIGFNADQLAHVACKAAWVAIATGAA
jgi:hypothetical protein